MNISETQAPILFPVLKVTQPLGAFYVASIDRRQLFAITYNDVRQLQAQTSDLDRYSGIQRKVTAARRRQLERYVNTVDATFPSSIIIAADDRCVSVDDGIMVIRPYTSDDGTVTIPLQEAALIIDGQHRIEGLKEYHQDKPFELSVSIFVGLDLADEAYIFSIVNLAQTKVNRSLVYDLYDYAATRSPIKTCHQIAVSLNSNDHSPFYRKIKRLGVKTSGTASETISQATFISALTPLISMDPLEDSELIKKKRVILPLSGKAALKMPFRNCWLEENDFTILANVANFFSAVRAKWPESWETNLNGQILNRTNGVRALMRVLRDLYNLYGGGQDTIPTEWYADRLKGVPLKDGSFLRQKYLPGSSGESLLYNEIKDALGVDSVAMKRNA